jgi:hypothetical protein
MKWFNCSQIVIVLAGFVAVSMLGGGTARADFTFGAPTLFDEPVNSTGVEYFDCISADGLEIYIERPVGGGIASNNWDLYVSTRETTIDPWTVPVSLGPTVNSSRIDGYASLSNDGLELYFSSSRTDGYGLQDIWVTARDNTRADWGTPVNLGPTINTSDYDMLPWITPDGLELYFSSDRPGGYGRSDIWVAARTTANDEWGEPVNLGPVVNSTAGEHYPCLSPDGLVLFFSDYDNASSGLRPGGYGRSDMWMTRRKSTADPWEPPVNLGPEVNTSNWNSQPRISPDGSVLYFTSSQSDIWQARILPIVDLNGDSIVDTEDMCIMVNHWGENYSLCDIGPTPFGDGIVDVQDLIILAEHLFEDVTDPTLISHWPLDEAQGGIAYNSAADCDGTLIGSPVWQPDGGMVAGSLQFDGLYDYVSTDPVLNPAEGKFSAIAWMKGGAPGQSVLSQADSASWLRADSSEGYLMTDLKSDRSSAPLLSQMCITDGDWHRVGFVWDGSYRHLYVDGTEVANDTIPLSYLGSANGGLYFGTGSTLAPASFFSGLIDDIRIYNRVVSP